MLFGFVFSDTFSQQSQPTATAILKKTEELYKSKNYLSYNSKYNLYLDYTSKNVYEQYAGMVLKKNKVNYFKIKNTEFVGFEDYCLKINNDEKALVIEKLENGSIEESPLSLNNYEKEFNTKLIYNKEYFIIELLPKNKFSQIMYSKIILYIRKINFSIVKQSFFFLEKMQSKDTKGRIIYSLPRLEIVLSPRINNEKTDNFLVNKENYLIGNGSNIEIAKRLSAYKIYKSY